MDGGLPKLRIAVTAFVVLVISIPYYHLMTRSTAGGVGGCHVRYGFPFDYAAHGCRLPAIEADGSYYQAWHPPIDNWLIYIIDLFIGLIASVAVGWMVWKVTQEHRVQPETSNPPDFQTQQPSCDNYLRREPVG